MCLYEHTFSNIALPKKQSISLEIESTPNCRVYITITCFQTQECFI